MNSSAISWFGPIRLTKPTIRFGWLMIIIGFGCRNLAFVSSRTEKLCSFCAAQKCSIKYKSSIAANELKFTHNYPFGLPLIPLNIRSAIIQFIIIIISIVNTWLYHSMARHTNYIYIVRRRGREAGWINATWASMEQDTWWWLALNKIFRIITNLFKLGLKLRTEIAKRKD